MRNRGLTLLGMALLASVASSALWAAAEIKVRSGMEDSMHFIESGRQGAAVVFIHGLAQSGVYWEEWVKALGKCGVHAVAVDLPGFGGSGNAPGPYTLPALADAVAGLIEKRKLGAVTVVGSSMGSAVAQFVALNHPAQVQRLILAATSAQSGMGGAPSPAAGAPAAGGPPMPAGGGGRAGGFRPGAMSPEQRREATKTRWQQNPPSATVDGFFHAKKPPAEYAERFYDAFRQMNFDAAAEVSEANGNWNTYDRLNEIKVPTLIIQGAEDASKSPAEGQRMAARISGARVVVLQDAAHTPQWDQRQAFDAAAFPFIMAGEPRTLRCEAPLAAQK